MRNGVHNPGLIVLALSRDMSRSPLTEYLRKLRRKENNHRYYEKNKAKWVEYRQRRAEAAPPGDKLDEPEP